MTWGAARVRADLNGVLGEAAGAGAAGVEIGLHLLDGVEAAMVRWLLARHGLAFIGGVLRLDLYDPARQSANHAIVRQGAALVATLGGRRLTVATLRNRPVPPTAAQVTAAVTALDALGRTALEAGIRLHYHNYSVSVASGELARVCAETDPALVSLTLDVAWLAKGGVAFTEFFPRWGHRVGHLHAKDIRDGQVVPVGDGTLDYASVVRALQAASYRGWLAVELERLLTGREAWAALDEDLTYQTVAEPAAMVARSIAWLSTTIAAASE
ncbi:MAG: TIM barrel protein [Chloroflexi bacterium]|nr:TIM barrel protein [Chloroflexota bacterium]